MLQHELLFLYAWQGVCQGTPVPPQVVQPWDKELQLPLQTCFCCGRAGMGWRAGAVQRVSAVPGTGLLPPAHRTASGRAGFFLVFILPCKSSKTRTYVQSK